MKAKQKTPQSPQGEAEREEDPSPVPTVQRYRRGAVSAEAYTEEDATSYVKKVVFLD